MNKYSPAVLSNLSGLSLPCGFTSAVISEPGTRNSKLPIGLQLLGKPLGEETILKLAHAYEQSTAWHREKPRLSS